MFKLIADILFKLYLYYNQTTSYCNFCCCHQVVAKSPQRRTSIESADDVVSNKFGLNSTKSLSASAFDEKTEYDNNGAGTLLNSLPDVAANNVDLHNAIAVSEGFFIFLFFSLNFIFSVFILFCLFICFVVGNTGFPDLCDLADTFNKIKLDESISTG